MNDATSAAPVRAAPRLEDFPHRALDIIRLGDLDHQNHVNNAVFATYFETGRVNFMRDVFGGLRFGDKNFVVARLEINYLRELHWPGMVDVCTGVERIGTSSVTYAQAAFHEGVCAASGRTTMVFIDHATRRATPMTDDILKRLRAQQMR
ncbi:MAG TPA: thioesterase family protein [Xanthobacteraceae bacterium]|nr:thioesterase family protein [Xanthobacteraceae bacterium]